jgi:hypothetical protein
MFSQNTRSNPSAAREVRLLSSRRLRVNTLSLVLVLGCVAAANPASARADLGLARSKYDGDWSVVIVTRRGACDPAFRYGVQIADGTIQAVGLATVQGRVSSSGAVRVVVQSGNEWAEGFGHLARAGGRGLWHGRGTRGACSGTWTAQRREFGASANE